VVRRGVIEGGDAFAGAGRPFRGAAERDAVLADYREVDETGNPGTPSELLLMQRR
jgi:hypothetical protein